LPASGAAKTSPSGLASWESFQRANAVWAENVTSTVSGKIRRTVASRTQGTRRAEARTACSGAEGAASSACVSASSSGCARRSISPA